MNYLTHIWHDPNCPAWHRNPRTNKDYPHLVNRRGETVCKCGYDEDYAKIQVFVSKMAIRHNLPRDPEVK